MNRPGDSDDLNILLLLVLGQERPPVAGTPKGVDPTRHLRQTNAVRENFESTRHIISREPLLAITTTTVYNTKKLLNLGRSAATPSRTVRGAADPGRNFRPKPTGESKLEVRKFIVQSPG
jgi:hypothetical protein